MVTSLHLFLTMWIFLASSGFVRTVMRFLASLGFIRIVMWHESTYLADCKGKPPPRRKEKSKSDSLCILHIVYMHIWGFEHRAHWDCHGSLLLLLFLGVAYSHYNSQVSWYWMLSQFNWSSLSELPCVKYLFLLFNITKKLHSLWALY